MDEQLVARDLQTVLRGLSADDIALKHGDPSRFVATFNNCAVGAVRFSGQPPWERHPDGDELLHVIEGELELTLLTPEGRVQVAGPARAVFLVPPRPRPPRPPRGASRCSSPPPPRTAGGLFRTSPPPPPCQIPVPS